MLINKKTKQVIEISSKPNENWIGDGYYLVDSRTELAEKIRLNAPYFEPITDGTGQLVDITPTERPEPEPEIEEPTQDEINLDFDFRITCLELGL